MIANDPVREQFVRLLVEVGRTEEELEAMRETVCQELMFNLQDAMRLFTHGQALNAIDLHAALNTQANISAVESMVRHYNDNQLMGFSKEHFGRVFLTRQNKLLAKLVSSRAPHSQLQQQKPLVDCIHRVLETEFRLHQKIVEFRKCNIAQRQHVERLIEGLLDGMWLDQAKLRQLLSEAESVAQPDFVIEYFQVSPKKDQKHALTTLRNTLTAANCQEVSSYLSKKTRERHARSNPKLKNPFSSDEFQRLLRQPQRIDKMSYREVQSIMAHLKRINSTRRIELSEKIDEYRQRIEREVKQLCVSLKDIIWLEKEVEYARVELALCLDFHPSVFFQSFCLERNGKLIASSMEDYLKKIGVDRVRTTDVYLLFKRFSKTPDGKLDSHEFASIFTSAQPEYREMRRNSKPCPLEDCSNATKIAYVEVLRVTLRNEAMIERIRQHLAKRRFFDVRNLFNCIDSDEDGAISMLDLRVLLQKHLQLEMSNFDVQLLLRRFNKRSPDDMLMYEEFAYEFTPRQNRPRQHTSPNVK